MKWTPEKDRELRRRWFAREAVEHIAFAFLCSETEVRVRVAQIQLPPRPKVVRDEAT